MAKKDESKKAPEAKKAEAPKASEAAAVEVEQSSSENPASPQDVPGKYRKFQK